MRFRHYGSTKQKIRSQILIGQPAHVRKRIAGRFVRRERGGGRPHRRQRGIGLRHDAGRGAGGLGGHVGGRGEGYRRKAKV